MSQVKNYLSLVKFSHTIFAMPFAMIGFVLGLKYVGATDVTTTQWNLNKTIGWAQDPTSNHPNYLLLFILVILCMVFARSAAMAFNRYLDRHFDTKNPRTAIREIPAGILQANSVLWFTIINCVLFITTTFFINRICFFLSPVALAVVLGYSYTKRFTALCHLVLGIGLSLAPIGAFLAVTGVFHLLAATVFTGRYLLGEWFRYYLCATG
jgi:4-hydroxybenzoate polyprenyltransferase